MTTRDVIAPVKKNAGIGDILKRYEREQVERVILPLLPDFLREEFAYILGFLGEEDAHEFSNRVLEEGRVRILEKIDGDHNIDGLMPVDGDLIKACDELGAYLEAFLSVSHGVKSRHLRNGLSNIERTLSNKTYGGLKFSEIVESLKERLEDI